ncbi:MAG TPA: protein kinase [Ignavibacteriaceae bacterium]|nr:protein kinase [Ignavibacteriaceae bacterium]
MIGKTILHYRILEKLGEGGMGVVYLAEDSKLKRQVAIKFLPHFIAANKEERQRFEIEAQAAASLNHPNISTIYAIEESDDEIFIVMEYIDGVELKDKINPPSSPLSKRGDTGGLPINEAINIAIQIAEGLEAAHKKGIIHRDIKSGNVMITKDGKVKIMDFGLAKIGGGIQITKIGSTIGTVAYMSPEQTRGDEIDNRSDIWSLGVILYEMLTGKLPYRGDFEQAVIYSILNEEPVSVSSIRKDIPLKLEQVIQKILNKNPILRYQSAEEFLKELKELQNKTGHAKSETDKTIAVLPFENISPDKETDYFADGLTEELIINLSRIKEVSIVARTNSMRFKGTNKDVNTIGRELGVRYIMTGSVRKFMDDLRISVQMIEVNKGIQLWGETYKGKLADIFDIQEKVSKEIADAMMLKLSPVEKVELTKKPTLNAEAFDCYLRGRNFLLNRTKNNLDFAILLFEKAVELDSRFAAAYAGLGEAYGAMYRDFDRQEVWLDKALDVSLKALMYDSSLSEAYASLGLAYFGKSELDQALAATKKAIELDPNNSNAYWILSRIYHSTDHDKEAIEALEKVVSINPNFFTAYDDLEMYLERIGDLEKYKNVLQTVISIVPKYLIQHPEDTYRRMAYAVTLAKVGKTKEAKMEGDKALELSPDDPIMMYYGACLYARLGEKKEAIRLIGDSIKSGYENFEWIKRDPDFENIRNEPEFVELINTNKI